MKSIRRFRDLALLAMLAACTANPITGRQQIILVPENQVISQAVSAYKSELDPHAKQSKLNNDSQVVQRVRGITDRLVAQAIRYRPDAAAWAWEVNVIDDPKTLNAFCLPGGKMAIYTGLINQLKASDDEIAQVMGHEIGHALANHGAEKMSRAMLGQVAVAAIAGGNQNRQQLGTALTQLGWMLPNSREAETEADRIGIELAARAGYDPAAAPQLWKKMMQASGDKGKFDWLSTHPASEKRMETLAALEPSMRPIYLEASRNPAALPTHIAANVRDVTPGSQLTSSNLKPLALYNPAYDQFRRGEARLECGSCAIKFSSGKDELRSLHRQADWEGLARAVLSIGYAQDISWFYLGASAEGLGLSGPARVYYQQAASLARHGDSHCKGGFSDLCNGVQLPQEAEAALVRLPR